MGDLEWLDGLGLDRTTLPQLPQQRSEMLGRLEANNGGLPRLPQPAPTEKSMYREGKVSSAHVEGADREVISAVKSDQQEAWAVGFLTCWKLLLHGGLLVYPAQQSGQTCHGCQHLDMRLENRPGTQRKYFWVCNLGHRQLEIGFAGERIIIAPNQCDQFSTAK